MSEGQPSRQPSLSVQLSEFVNFLPAAPVLLHVPANLNPKSESKTSKKDKNYCEQVDCPLNIEKIQHHTGTYFHPGLKHHQSSSFFAHCCPPIFIWEAYRRLVEYKEAKRVLATKMEHKSFDAAMLKEETTVRKFLEYHGGSGGYALEDVMPFGAQIRADIGGVQFPTSRGQRHSIRASDSPASRLDNMGRRLNELSTEELYALLGSPNSSGDDSVMASFRELQESLNGMMRRLGRTVPDTRRPFPN